MLLNQLSVSISQSRILSFQAENELVAGCPRVCEFQSRNRESYLFKGGLPEALLYVPESEAFL